MIQQGGGEVDGRWLQQQHDGVVVVKLQYSGRTSLSTMEEEEMLERKREAPKAKVRSPPSPPLYIGGPRGAPALGDPIS